MRGSCVIFSSNTDNGLNVGSFYLNANNVTSNVNIDSDTFVKRFKQKPTLIKFSSVISYYGWSITSDCYNLWNKYINVKFKTILYNMNVSNKVIRS